MGKSAAETIVSVALLLVNRVVNPTGDSVLLPAEAPPPKPQEDVVHQVRAVTQTQIAAQDADVEAAGNVDTRRHAYIYIS